MHSHRMLINIQQVTNYFLNAVATEPWPPLLLKVRASYNGQVKEMIPNGRGTWAGVSWPYQSNNIASLKCLELNKTEVWTRPEGKKLMKTYPDLFFSASHRMVGRLIEPTPVIEGHLQAKPKK